MRWGGGRGVRGGAEGWGGDVDVVALPDVVVCVVVEVEVEGGCVGEVEAAD